MMIRRSSLIRITRHILHLLLLTLSKRLNHPSEPICRLRKKLPTKKSQPRIITQIHIEYIRDSLDSNSSAAKVFILTGGTLYRKVSVIIIIFLKIGSRKTNCIYR